MLAGEVVAKFGADNTKFLRAIDQNVRSMEKMAQGARGAEGSFSKSGRSISASLDGVGMKLKDTLVTVGKFAVANKAIDVLTSAFSAAKSAVFDYNSMIEQTRIGLTTMLGSAEKANTFLSEMEDFAARTPFEFGGLVKTANQMLALGFAADEILPNLTAVGDAVAAMGGTMNDMGERVVRALGQMRAKGKVSAEEMMQLAEAGLPAWKYLADAIGTDIPTAMDTARKKGVEAGVAIDAILKGMSRDFGGMMAAQSKTLQGSMSTVMDYVQMNVGRMTMPIYESFRDLMVGLAATLSSADFEAKTAEIGKAIADGFNAVKDFAIPILVDAIEYFGNLFEISVKVAQALKPMFTAGVVAGAAFLKIIQSILSALNPILDMIANNEVAIKALAIAVGALVAAFAAGKVVSFFSEIQKSIATTVTKLDAFTRSASLVGKTADAGFKQSLGSARVSQTAIAGLNQSLSGTVTMASRMTTGMKNAGSALMGAMGGPAGIAITAGITAIGYGFNRMATGAADAKADVDALAKSLMAVGQEGEQQLFSEIFAHLNEQDFAKYFDDGAKEVEVSYGRIAKAIRTTADEVEAFGDSEMQLTGHWRNQFAAMDKNSDAWQELDEHMKAVGSSADDFVETDYGKYMLELARNTNLTDEAFMQLARDSADTADVYGQAAEQADDLTRAQKELAKESELAGRAVQTFGGSLGKFAADEEMTSRFAKGNEGMVKEIQKTVEAIDQSLNAVINPFEKFTDESQASIDEFLSNLNDNIGYVTNWKANIEKLISAGLSPQALSYIVEQGPAAMGKAVAEMAAQPDKYLPQFEAGLDKWGDASSMAVDFEELGTVMSNVMSGMSSYEMPTDLRDTLEHLKQIGGEEFKIKLGLNDAEFVAGFKNSVDAIIRGAQDQKIPLKAEIEADTMQGVTDRLNAFFKDADIGITPNMKPDQAYATFADFVKHVADADPQVALDAYDDEAVKTFRSFLKYVEDETGITNLSADPKKAVEVLGGLLNQVDSSSGTVSIRADDSAFQRTWRNVLETINNIPFVNIPVRAAPQSADGNIFRSFAVGGMESHNAMIASGKTPVRVWAEPETGGEAYIPLSMAKRARSTELLAQVAKMFGYGLQTPQEQMPVLGGLRLPGGDPGASEGPMVADVTTNVTLEIDGQSIARATHRQLTNAQRRALKEVR